MAIKGPATRPINPKARIPPSTEKKRSKGWIFVLVLIKNGLRILSTILITNTPKPNRISPFKKAPSINKMIEAGAQMRAVPPMGIKDNRDIAVPQKIGEGSPRAQKENPPKSED